MTFLDGLFLFLLISLLWFAFLYVLYRTKKLERPDEEGTTRWGLALMGPFLMWKTGKGRVLIDRLAQRRGFWRRFGDFSIVLVTIAMVAMTAMLLWLAVLVVNIPPSRAPSPELILGIPGVNRLIPVTYGILGLAVAIVVHEFCHGILARTARIKVNSLGLLFYVVPIGAFVEPDEGEMKAMPRRERARLFAAGPATNLLFALAFALVFSVLFMGSVAPVANGVPIGSVTPNSPAETLGLQPGYVLLSVNGTATPDALAFSDAMAKTHPGDNVTVTWTAKGFAAPRQGHAVLGDAGNFTGDPARKGVGFLGVGAYLSRITTAPFHPIGGAGELGGLAQSLIAYISLPFTGLQPMEGLATQFYVVQGPMAALGDSFWALANAAYWLMWLNLMLGMTNALPAVPLDGGYLFRDGLHALIARVRGGMAAERREKVVRNVSYGFAFLILGLILWQFIGPRVL